MDARRRNSGEEGQEGDSIESAHSIKHIFHAAASEKKGNHGQHYSLKMYKTIGVLLLCSRKRPEGYVAFKKKFQ